MVPSACPLTQEIDTIRHLEDAGASAVVLYSLFEEQLKESAGSVPPSAVAKSLAADSGEFRNSPQAYLEHIRKAKEAVKIPVIASLNGTTPGGRTQYAKEIQQAGADALECNIFQRLRFVSTGSRSARLTHIKVIFLLEKVEAARASQKRVRAVGKAVIQRARLKSAILSLGRATSPARLCFEVFLIQPGLRKPIFRLRTPFSVGGRLDMDRAARLRLAPLSLEKAWSVPFGQGYRNALLQAWNQIGRSDMVGRIPGSRNVRARTFLFFRQVTLAPAIESKRLVVRSDHVSVVEVLLSASIAIWSTSVRALAAGLEEAGWPDKICKRALPPRNKGSVSFGP